MAAPRFHTIDFLRGVAALAVVWGHFSGHSELPAIYWTGYWGWTGVAIFFVISGFIIPHTLALANYDLGKYGTFLFKRIVRLDPAYLVTIAVILTLGYLDQFAPGFKGPSTFHPTAPQVLMHLGYLNAIAGYDWLNVVFWTLAVEFQYYLLLGAVFPLLVSPRRWLRFAILALFGASAFLIPRDTLFFHYAWVFMMGFVTFYFRAGQLARGGYLAALAVVTAGAWGTVGYPYTLAGLAAALVIAFFDLRTTRWNFLGHLSYSLYLIHVPIGSRVLRLSEKYLHGLAGPILGPLVAAGGSIAAAWLLHRWVERPSQLWSSAIGYRSRQVAPTGFGPRVG